MFPLRFRISVAQHGRNALAHARASTRRCSEIIDYLTTYDAYEADELDDHCSDDERHGHRLLCDYIFESRGSNDDAYDDE